MQHIQRRVIGFLLVVTACFLTASPVEARYGHRNYRGYRSGRSYNRYAGAQRAAVAMNSAQARVAMAQASLIRATKQAKAQAENSPALSSANQDHVQSQRDYQTARATVIAKLKENNPDLRELIQQSKSLQDKVGAMARSGKGDYSSLQTELRTKTRKVAQIEDEAVNSDPTIKDIVARTASAHKAQVDAQKQAQAAMAQDPSIQAARNQLMQASQQANLASNQYANALGSMNNGGYYGRRRGYGSGYGGYGYGGSGYRGYHHHGSYRVAHHRHVRF